MKKLNLLSPLTFNLIALNVLGLWPTGDSFQTSALYKIYSIIIINFLAALHTSLQLINLFFIYDDFPLLMSSLYVALPDLAAVIKIVFFVRNLGVIKRVIRDLDEDIFQPRNDQQRATLKIFTDTWMKVFFTFGGAAIATLCLWSIYPILDKSAKKGRLPFVSWYPFNHKITPVYQILYVYQIVSTYHIAGINFTVDTLIAAIMMYTAGQCNILCDDLRNIYRYTENDLKESGEFFQSEDDLKQLVLSHLNKNLVTCIHHHKTILSFADNCNKFLDSITITQFGVSMFSLGLAMVQLTLLVPLTPEFYTLMTYLMAIFVQILMYCWFGNEVVVESGEIPYAIFESDWVDAPLAFKKNMLFFICRTQKPIRFRAVNFFVLSLETFTKILRSSWSYFALLRQATDSE